MNDQRSQGVLRFIIRCRRAVARFSSVSPAAVSSRPSRLCSTLPEVRAIRQAVMQFGGSGFLWASMIIGFRDPDHAKSAAWGVGLGLPLAIMDSFVTSLESANLRPLALIFGTVVGMSAALLGAHVARFQRSTSMRHEGAD